MAFRHHLYVQVIAEGVDADRQNRVQNRLRDGADNGVDVEQCGRAVAQMQMYEPLSRFFHCLHLRSPPNCYRPSESYACLINITDRGIGVCPTLTQAKVLSKRGGKVLFRGHMGRPCRHSHYALDPLTQLAVTDNC